MTVCSQDHKFLFGDVSHGRMRLSDEGCIVQTVWNELPVHYSNVECDAFVVMPNHVHGIIVLSDGIVQSNVREIQIAVVVGAGFKPALNPALKLHGLPEIVRAFKTYSAKCINEFRRTPGIPVWQRGYYERVVRRTNNMHRIREYILNNPLRWAFDRENPQHKK